MCLSTSLCLWLIDVIVVLRVVVVVIAVLALHSQRLGIGVHSAEKPENIKKLWISGRVELEGWVEGGGS